MRFTVSSTLLNKKLSAIAKVINSKNALPILSHFLFKVGEDNTITVTAADSENTIVTTLEVTDVEDTGIFAVNANTLLNSLKEIPEQPITFDADMESYTLTVDYFSGVFKVPVSEGNTYPPCKDIEDGETLTILNTSLLDAVSRAVTATAEDDLRPVMNGIFFDLNNENGFTVVATDGHSLVKNFFPDIKGESGNSFNFILPKKPAQLLKTMLAGEDSEVSIVSNGINAKFVSDSFTLYCRLIEGRYPNYNTVIPLTSLTDVTVDRKQLLSSFKRIVNFANSSSQLIAVDVTENNMQLNAEDIDFSISAKEKIGAEVNGENVRIGLKASKVISGLSILSSEKVILKMNGSTRAVIIAPENEDSSCQITILVMPMLVNE